MTDERPNPDKLLGALKNEGTAQGRLRIYFGYAAGVGKSYAMLRGAQELRKAGTEVVVGYLEAHARPETQNQLLGLEQIPALEVDIGGRKFKEMDLDAVLKRRPQVVLVDEMAHTNAPSCRHIKRWQDIQELLQAGIDVYTTLNVQHIASLNDVVAQITGVQVRETLPDSAFDEAAEVMLVDITPDELLKRFKEGKIYKGAQVEKALGNYFKKSNLVALREIALRRTAERVHADVDQARLTTNTLGIVPTQERLACLIDSDNASATALTTAARLSNAMQCPWYALSVDSAGQLSRGVSEEKRYQKQLQLAKDLGGKIAYRSGAFRILEAIRYAREENITKLIIARPRGLNIVKWIERLAIFFVGDDLDVIWVSPSAVAAEEKATPPPFSAPAIRPYIETTIIMIVTFCVTALMGYFHAPEASITMVYLLGVVVAAVIHGEGASAYAACLSAFILSFGLTTFTVRLSWENTHYLTEFGITLLIGLLASQMTSRLKNQAEMARREHKLTESLFNFTSALSASTGLHEIVTTAQTHLKKFFQQEFCVLIPSEKGGYRPLFSGSASFDQDPAVWAVAEWVGSHNQEAGLTTQTLPHAKAFYMPLASAENVIGVLAIGPGIGGKMQDRLIYEKFSHALASKIESAKISQNAEQIYWQAERERLRGDLLGSVSEGLKLPLAVIAASSASLLADEGTLEPTQRKELLELINEEAGRLERVVSNLAQLRRVESGSLPLHKEQLELNEFIQAEIFKFRNAHQAHPISFRPSEAAIQANLDPLLFAQVIHNIIENALTHTPAGTKIFVSTQALGNKARLIIEDEGMGLPEEHLEKIFDKYYHLGSHGAGLGLTVSRAIAEAHGAKLWAENRAPHGLRLVIELR